MKKNKIENWEEIILKSCIEAEKMYQLESDKTCQSWLVIYEANVIREIRQLLIQEKAKNRQEIIEKIDKIYKKEQGIHNWLDLREKLKEEIKRNYEKSI